MYEPSTGRFTSLDPFFGDAHNPQSFHKYLYAHGDPVNLVDPTGRSADGISIATANAIGAALVGKTVVTGIALGYRTFRNPGGNQARWRWNPTDITRYARVDANLLESHLHSVRIRNALRLTPQQLFAEMTRLEDTGFVYAYPAMSSGARRLGDVVWFDMYNQDLQGWWHEIGQGDFAVKIVGVDINRYVFTVRTLLGHPVAGWRQWELHDEGGGNFVIKTFSVEHGSTDVDQWKLDHGGLNGMYKTWDVMLETLAAKSGGQIDYDSPDTLLRSGTRHRQFNVQDYRDRLLAEDLP